MAASMALGRDAGAEPAGRDVWATAGNAATNRTAAKAKLCSRLPQDFIRFSSSWWHGHLGHVSHGRPAHGFLLWFFFSLWRLQKKRKSTAKMAVRRMGETPMPRR
jgi:hypothetical protein